MDFKTLVSSCIMEQCHFAEVIQIILLHKSDGLCWNYFTHILLSDSILKSSKRKYLTSTPKSINSEYKVIITKEVISKKDVLGILKNAEDKQKWEWREDVALLDRVFSTNPQFIPETDPTGNKTSDSTLVPVEAALYGSNFMGGYYLCELFSAKKYLDASLSEDDLKKIQKIIHDAGLGYNLESLSDRIGNIVCKVPISIIKHKQTRLTPERGIAGQFILNSNLCYLDCILQIIIENDNMIIETNVEEMVFSDKEKVKSYCVKPNRYKNRIILSDKNTGVIYYSAIRDYSYGSNYYAVITPPQYGIQSSLKRTILINGNKIEIELTNIAGMGEVTIEKEIYEMEKRQHKWLTEYEYKHHFFNSFIAGQEKDAIKTIIEICNDRDLFWDLEEIWLVDPYLSASDILNTVVYCGKYGISIKCLTHIATINNNVATQIQKSEDKSRFRKIVEQYHSELSDALSIQTDMKIEFRTVVGMEGSAFHDRYLILKYGMNKSRAWSLGISVNSLGKSHHIIQIVQSPMDVIETINTIWKQSCGKECLIYSNIDE